MSRIQLPFTNVHNCRAKADPGPLNETYSQPFQFLFHLQKIARVRKRPLVTTNEVCRSYEATS